MLPNVAERTSNPTHDGHCVDRTFRRRVIFASIASVVFVSMLATLRVGPHIWSWPRANQDVVRAINALRVAPNVEPAWPAYDLALAKLPGAREVTVTTDPNDQDWPTLASWLEQHQEAVEELRRAAGLPHLGVPLDPEATRSPARVVADQPLPWLASLRTAGRVMAAESLRRAILGDLDGAISFLEGGLGVTAHLNEGLWLEELVGCAISQLPSAVVGRFVLRDDIKMSAEDRTRIDRLFANINGGKPWRPSFRQESLAFDDLLQRAYSDDGDLGCMTLDGCWLVDRVVGRVDRGTVGALLRAMRAPRRGAERAEFDRRERLVTEFLGSGQRPNDWREQLDAPADDSAFVAASLGPGILWIEVADALLANRRAVPVMLALDAYHQRTGTWPATLTELVPHELSAVDPFLAPENTLVYSRVDGKPRLEIVNAKGRRPIVGDSD